MHRLVYDISMPIYEGMPVYKNKPEKQPSFTITSDFSHGSVRETRVALDVHCGTHVDAPLHMVENGATIDTIALNELVRPCRVVDLTHVVDGITAQDLESLSISAGDFLLFKTKNSWDTTFNPEFIYLKEDGARFLAERRVAGVGIDALGIERSQPGHPTHKALFACGAIVIEGLRLADVPAGQYLMVAAPIALQGLDAAPARVLLLAEEANPVNT
ncbi:cyclase [Alicyclobacillus contaminans]|uniref:cyclase family protein n=1 Tax=Alicyclobacillus contaminans TaxID=392016 RepID=UPI0003F63451|nr:cyclase family protein [Alicyclobacillus contaminans]GMA49633.1 cyclase [Alicyclobacillus contaminans]